MLSVPRNVPSHTLMRFWQSGGKTLSSFAEQIRGPGRLGSMFHLLSEPRLFFDWWRGIEDFNFPGTWQLLDLVPERPEVLHCHNLHGGYFDLRALPLISNRIPVVLTLHDAWMLSGHCAHSFDCERWKTGCGQCPDLTIYPAVRRDATALNWQRKREIYLRSQFYVATPSRWLMRKVEQSILAPSIMDARIIPNGVDLSVFHPADKDEVRSQLGVPSRARVLLFVANSIRSNIWKDYQTMRRAVELVAANSHGEALVFLGLGENAPPERIGRAEVHFFPYEHDPRVVAKYFQAADIYIHAARVDNFPLTVLEALACGVPVVATAVGGIPEQIKDGSTGSLVPPSNPEAMANAIERLLSDEILRRQFSSQGAAVARNSFSLDRQADAYLEWYAEIGAA